MGRKQGDSEQRGGAASRRNLESCQRDLLLRQLKSPSTARVSEAERLTALLAERLAEVLPPREFRLKLTQPIISIDGIGKRYGNGYSTAPAVCWYLPLPVSRRLRMIFESQTRDIQRFLSNVSGAQWPTPGAKPHVDVTPTTICAWWGGPTEADAVVRLRPIARDELGV
jgi:hypothetical protein